jgi:hypothetical protein
VKARLFCGVRSPLNDHIETILLLRKQNKDFKSIAEYLTSIGLKTSTQNVFNFYYRLLKRARKIRKEMEDIEFYLHQMKEAKASQSINSEVQSYPSNQPTVIVPSDPWKPRIIKPPVREKPEPKVEPKKDPADDFVIGPDVLR